MGSNNNDILDELSIVDKYVQIAINKLHLSIWHLIKIIKETKAR